MSATVIDFRTRQSVLTLDPDPVISELAQEIRTKRWLTQNIALVDLADCDDNLSQLKAISLANACLDPLS